jgi:diaminopropionate ammonia-lyase
LAASIAGFARSVLGEQLKNIVVEPEAALALIESIKAGKVIETTRPVSQMGRLDCKTPSREFSDQ